MPDFLAIALLSGPDATAWQLLRRGYLGHLCMEGARYLVAAALGMAVVAGLMSGQMVIYRDPARHGWVWLLAGLPLMILWHDFYFYFTHRALHTTWLLRHVHGVHHRSRDPSPWAAYAFHPIEALVNGLVTPLALLAVPRRWSVLLLFALHQIIRNAHGHAAVEIMPRGFARHWLGGRFTTTTHHHPHHATARGNYGLWFTWWDRWCGTERANYLARFDQATPPRPGPPCHPPCRAADGTCATLEAPPLLHGSL